MAVSAAEYILNELYWSEGGPVAGFSYPVPGLRTQVHNANFLASALLCRAYRVSGDETLLAPALKAARHSAAAQAADGSWRYGESTTQGWVDHFHTGYNLCALQSIARNAGTAEFDATIRNGFHFYRTHLFDVDGVPKYFSNRRYPVDAHCIAQSMITLIELKDLAGDNISLADSVFAWAMKHMWDERGYFYYQVLPVGTIKLSYMRWTQAWMLLALSTLFEHHQESLLGETASAGREAMLASSGSRH
jgi:mannose/cellobiose epimerase-like protein (N-acyl-D-glucosamine 2-epimerase family)